MKTSAFDKMGKPISLEIRSLAEKHMKDMGVNDSGLIFETVQQVSFYLENDLPMEALQKASKALDLCGSYRLMAVLLAGTPC